MAKEIEKTAGGHLSPFERIKRTNDAGTEFWSSRQFAGVLGYGDYRNFEGVIEKAKLSCFNSGHRIEDHFVDVTEMVTIGSGAERAVKTVLLSRYACYLAIQNADPKKEIVAHGQTYFAIQTRRQELAANLFRATQAEEKLRRDEVKGRDAANRTHREVGAKVRQTIRELGGTMPEGWPKASRTLRPNSASDSAMLRRPQKRKASNRTWPFIKTFRNPRTRFSTRPAASPMA